MRKLVTRDIQWSPELAYFVGLLVTDGNLSKDGRHICLRSSDLQLVNTVNNHFLFTNKIGRDEPTSKTLAKKTSFRLQFSDAALYRWLETIGLFPAKTYTIGEINVPSQHFRDFVRGHLDGDGTVMTYIDEYNTYRERKYTNFRLCIYFLSASKSHMVWLRKMINLQTGCRGALIQNHKRPNTFQTWRIKYAKKESVQLLNWLYYNSDLLCLERKRDIALKALEIILNTKRKKVAFIE